MSSSNRFYDRKLLEGTIPRKRYLILLVFATIFWSIYRSAYVSLTPYWNQVVTTTTTTTTERQTATNVINSEQRGLVNTQLLGNRSVNSSDKVQRRCNILIAVSTTTSGILNLCPAIGMTWARTAVSLLHLSQQQQQHTTVPRVDVEYYYNSSDRYDKEFFVFGPQKVYPNAKGSDDKDNTLGLERMVDLILTLATKVKTHSINTQNESYTYDWVVLTNDEIYIDVVELVSFLRRHNSNNLPDNIFSSYGNNNTVFCHDHMTQGDRGLGGQYVFSSSAILNLAKDVQQHCVSVVVDDLQKQLGQNTKNMLSTPELCAQAIRNVTTTNCQSLPVYQNTPANFTRMIADNAKGKGDSMDLVVPVLYNHIHSKTDMIKLHSILVAQQQQGSSLLSNNNNANSILVPPWQNRFIFPTEFSFEDLDQHPSIPLYAKGPRYARNHNNLLSVVRELYKTNMEPLTHPNFRRPWRKATISIRKCVNCGTAVPSYSLYESWYTATHPLGVITVRGNDLTGEIRLIQQQKSAQEETGSQSSSLQNETAATTTTRLSFESFDLLVPCKGRLARERLLRLIQSAHDSIDFINRFRRQTIRVRVLFSAHQTDDEWIVSNQYIRDITNAFQKHNIIQQQRDTINTTISNGDGNGGKAAAAAVAFTIGNYIEVIAVPCNYYKKTGENLTQTTTATNTTVGEGMFQKTVALNALLDRSCQSKSCIVAAVDVDLTIAPSFFINAMDFVHPFTTAYFPIIYSQFNPETVQLLQTELKKSQMAQFLSETYEKADHAGQYRPTGVGMWAMAGSDAVGFRFDTSFKGWGREDVAFFQLVSGFLHTIRMEEPGLVHVWHKKTCELGSFVTSKELQKLCERVSAKWEGTPFGVYLRDTIERKGSTIQ